MSSLEMRNLRPGEEGAFLDLMQAADDLGYASIWADTLDAALAKIQALHFPRF